MLFAASESAVTKKPRLRFTISRSSSVSPSGFFQRAMSRLMFTSWGIQWFAQPLKYFSQAHLYLKGTSWFTSVFALMTRLSSARTRVKRSGTSAWTCGFNAGEGALGMDPSETFTDSSRSVGAMGVSSSKLSIRFSFGSVLAAAAGGFGFGHGLQPRLG